MGKIITIRESSFSNLENSKTINGFVITTDNGEIKIGVSSEQDEAQKGTISTEIDLLSLVGVDVTNVTIGDKLEYSIKNFQIEDIFKGGAMIVNLETSKGLIQFVNYNSHDGSNPHEMVVISNFLTATTTL